MVEYLAYSMVEEKENSMVVMMVCSWVDSLVALMVVWMEIMMVEN